MIEQAALRLRTQKALNQMKAQTSATSSEGFHAVLRSSSQKALW
jgi:hypothetical protein